MCHRTAVHASNIRVPNKSFTWIYPLTDHTHAWCGFLPCGCPWVSCLQTNMMFVAVFRGQLHHHIQRVDSTERISHPQGKKQLHAVTNLRVLVAIAMNRLHTSGLGQGTSKGWRASSNNHTTMCGVYTHVTDWGRDIHTHVHSILLHVHVYMYMCVHGLSIGQHFEAANDCGI